MYSGGYYPGVRLGRADSLSLLFAGAILLSALYVGVFMACLIKVHLQSNFLHGFYRPFLLPGPYVDDRYTYPWYFLMIHNVRLAAIPGLIWIFHDLEGLIYSAIVSAAFGVLVVVDILLLVAVFVMGCFFCNNGVFRNGLCDTKNLTAYCEAFWKDQWEICDPGADPPLLAQCDLSPNPAFNNFAYFLLGFLALDIIISLYVWLVTRWSISAQRRASNILFWMMFQELWMMFQELQNNRGFGGYETERIGPVDRDRRFDNYGEYPQSQKYDDDRGEESNNESSGNARGTESMTESSKVVADSTANTTATKRK